MIRRTYKFRLYPTQPQYVKLNHTLDSCRWTYNKMVEKIRKEGFQSRNDLNYFLTELKEKEPWLYEHHSKMLQMVSTQLYGAQKSLVQLRENGYRIGSLKFARFSEYNAFVYNQSGFDIKDSFLCLSKIGKIKIICHRQFPANSEIKQIIVSKSKSGKWYACVLCEIDAILPKISLQNTVGIDVGIRNFAYDSDGFAVPNPLNLQQMLKPLCRVQRKMSRRHEESCNYKKAVRWYQIIHERIKNKRRDFLHKLSTYYARKYDVVFVERLAKLNMIQNRRLARSILDSGWGIFTNMLDYKCMRAYIPAANTTIDCSRCGNSVPKTLAIRTHVCNVCGLVLDRDHNAAINILQKGLAIFEINLPVPQELRELTPVEISMRSRKQEEAARLSCSGSHNVKLASFG